MRELGDRRYEPAVRVLAGLLSFQRPQTEEEKQGIYRRMQSVWEIYPAAAALDSIGRKALPAVLEVIEARSASPTARENALAVWMGIYRHDDRQPKGVAALREEETKAKDNVTRERLRWAVEKALTWCNPPEQAACKDAAR